MNDARKHDYRSEALRRSVMGILAFVVILVVLVAMGVGERATPTLRRSDSPLRCVTLPSGAPAC